MHRTHDREVETLEISGRPKGLKNPAPQLPAGFSAAPLFSGAALIWGGLWGVKPKIAFFLQSAKTLKNRPHLWYRCAATGFEASISSDSAVGEKTARRCHPKLRSGPNGPR